MNHAKIFVNRVEHFVLFDHLLGFLKLHVEILKIILFPVVQLYVEIFE